MSDLPQQRPSNFIHISCFIQAEHFENKVDHVHLIVRRQNCPTNDAVFFFLTKSSNEHE